MRKATKIEKIVRDILLLLNVKFIREYKIGNYPVDFYLPDYNLTIQCDGCYHHGHKGCSTYVKARQIFQRVRDKACIAYHKYNKINIIRLHECDILKKPEKIYNYIQGSIERINNGEKIFHKGD
jgi:very-short-patch-repair endonuclease